MSIQTSGVQDNFVSLDDATSLASVLEYPTFSIAPNGRAKQSGSTFKDVESVLEIPDQAGDPSMYIVNYADGGYIMISADNRINPIRAFSTTDKFPFNAEYYPSGLLAWFEESTDMIYDVRVLDQEQTTAVAQSWEVCEVQNIITKDDIASECSGGSDGCQNSYTLIEPLLWHRS